MQNMVFGDAGDYGTMVILRRLERVISPIGVNWYRNGLEGEIKSRQYFATEDATQLRAADPELFDFFRNNCGAENFLCRFEHSGLLCADIWNTQVPSENRAEWHANAERVLEKSELIFLSPDIGLQTAPMEHRGQLQPEHAGRQELEDYYRQGKSVILTQRRGQFEKKGRSIESLVDFAVNRLCSGAFYILEFPNLNGRFLALFLQENHHGAVGPVVRDFLLSYNPFCRQVISG